MVILWLLLAAAVLLAFAWLLVPYLDWRSVEGKAVEAHISKTSFKYTPGELVHPKGKTPEVSLSVVVPAYNEEYRIPVMLDETLTYLEGRVASSYGDFSYEVIVVDDGSRDGTYAAALASQLAGSRNGGALRVMQLSKNGGKGYAVRAGMLVARGQLLLMADADGATGIGELEKLERALDPSSDIVFGSRHHLKDDATKKRSFLRTFLMVGFHFVVACLVGGPIKDTQCGFKLFRSSVGKTIFSSLHLYRWAFDIEIVILARMLGKSIAEVPVKFVDVPGSKLNLVTGSLTMLRDIVLVRALYILGMWRPA